MAYYTSSFYVNNSCRSQQDTCAAPAPFSVPAPAPAPSHFTALVLVPAPAPAPAPSTKFSFLLVAGNAAAPQYLALIPASIHIPALFSLF